MSAKFVVAVAYVIEKGGTVLMLRRSLSKDHAPGEWETGSGRVEAGETPEQAVRREVREETGLQIEIVGPVDTFHFYRGAGREEVIGITFWCRYDGGEFAMCDEHDRAEWLAFDKAIALLGDNGAAAAVAKIAGQVRSASRP
jgi:8-oxo-dGTP diphosphatase